GTRSRIDMRSKAVKTSNVVKFLDALDVAWSRGESEEGMVFLHGDPGEGKTTAVTYVFNHVGGVYVRALRIWTPLGMLQSLAHELELPQHGRKLAQFKAIT